MTSGFAFCVHDQDSQSAARRSTLTTPHGDVEMPAFMPVGTQGAVKGVTADHVVATGAQMVLSNAYHLAVRPGTEIVRRLGGLHHFMGWSGPILTDSGGFQVFSLQRLTKVTEEGVEFRSHVDGAKISLTPERAVQIQGDLGSDIAMVLDHVVSLPNSRDVIEDACRRSIRWAQRSLATSRSDQQALFGIVQGGLDQPLRIESAEALAELDFDGYAIGGLSVGESAEDMLRTIEFTIPALPAGKPRYLMGVGRPEDILEAVARGIDLFDCVMPTRNGRNAMAFTDSGTLRLRNERHREDTRPLEETCDCLACRHSRGYLRHLFMSGEMLGPILLSIHNLTYYQRLLQTARTAIKDGRFVEFKQQMFQGWTGTAAAG
ncbi:MAG TPA: tRNA guanosine(34) transglycosylase Tgt [Pirellulales bacterium]|nr:tRNA guanosine(34) transglycosylase Tgt [Pirellulales bacterium]